MMMSTETPQRFFSNAIYLWVVLKREGSHIDYFVIIGSTWVGRI